MVDKKLVHHLAIDFLVHSSEAVVYSPIEVVVYFPCEVVVVRPSSEAVQTTETVTVVWPFFFYIHCGRGREGGGGMMSV
jgi:hypothetical protein